MSTSDLPNVVRCIDTAPRHRKVQPISVELTVSIEDCEVGGGYRMTIKTPKALCQNRVTFVKGMPDENGKHLLSWSPTRGLGALLSIGWGVKRVEIVDDTISLWVKHSWRLIPVKQRALRIVANHPKWNSGPIKERICDRHTVTRYEQLLRFVRRDSRQDIPANAAGAEA